MVVEPLQEMLLKIVPTQDIINVGLVHVLGPKNRIAQDLVKCSLDPIPQWFLRMLLDTGDTLFYWFRSFIKHKMKRLLLNRIMFVGDIQKYRNDNSHSVNTFAMRVDTDSVILFVYSTPKKLCEDGIYRTENATSNLKNQKHSNEWADEDWDFLRPMVLQCAFVVDG